MTPTEPTTLNAALQHAAQQWPDRPLLGVLAETAAIYRIDAGEISYADALQQVNAISEELSAAGYQAGQRVLLLLENRPLFFLYWLALNHLGLSIVPANPDLRAAELQYLIGHAEPVLAISITSHQALLREAANAAKIDMPIIEPGATIPSARQRTPVTNAPSDSADPLSHEAALLYTSGTTGLPKACVLSNDYFLLAGHWYATAGGACTLSTDHERMLTPLPLFHMNAIAYSFMAMLTVGGCLICLDRFHPRSWWHSVNESRATCLHYLGVMPSLLMNAATEPSDRDHTASVRFGFGAGVDPSLHHAFEQRFGFPLVEAWAMTETGAGAVIAANHEPRRVGSSCFGRPSNEIEINIVDDEGVASPADSPGELLVRRAGKHPKRGFFSAYYKDPQATAEAWHGGWFHTGDIVKQSATGDLRFVDRKKNIIRRSGENIAAAEVEATLARHPAIAVAAVAAVPDPDALRGDEVFACLQVTTDPSPQLAEEIVRWCLGQLAYFKAPGYIAFVNSNMLPLTATQKIQRGALKKLAATLLNDPATVRTVELKKRQTV